ncbi:MAG: saccharopine dehydrogenase C-terminal domain-containing protein [Gemmatimonadota bacterium]|nr:saccharopine dehydrogenase C-terminal domain-containing protein [Gemmatimonadota bacterium]
MELLVLGGGAQGSACAFDLANSTDVEAVTVADQNVDRPASFLAPLLGDRLNLRRLDASDPRALGEAVRGFDVVVCALPYHFNLQAARAAVEAGAHFCDLGGNTEIVRRQQELDAEARSAGISVVPDCGLAPGMVNILARGGIDALEDVASVRIYVGGLPRIPHPPLNYRVAYSLEGVLDYYTTPVLKLEEGRVVEREPMTEVERVDFGAPLGELEAFLTAGGISTMPYDYEGRVASMTYKTLRYPGHADLMKAIRDLGLLSDEPIAFDGCRVSPREMFIRAVGPSLEDPDAEDLVALRVVVAGRGAKGAREIRYDLLDVADMRHGISAMMRTTGYSLAAVARLQGTGRIPPGVHTPAECVPLEAYLTELAARDIHVRQTVT